MDLLGKLWYDKRGNVHFTPYVIIPQLSEGIEVYYKLSTSSNKEKEYK